ncbi:hypothetical protein RND81_13G025400 [Saponaria officinalis]|uniref:Palmitoyl-protein thioesterase n=1 Tax=Saponaria officinalis TaxID=3572 RepID=A0AAW1GTA6_SAPOF
MTVAKSLFTFIFTSFFLHFAQALPFILLHGVREACSHNRLTFFTTSLAAWSNSNGTCLEIGSGVKTSMFRRLDQQVAYACNQIKSMEHLKNGYNLIGVSQGAIIGRGIIEMCADTPQVNNFISLGGPQAGVASFPRCNNWIAPSGYLRLPNNHRRYLKGCRYLPEINNEREGQRNITYKNRFSNLANLVLIKFESDTVLVPKETSWFGFYEDGSFDKILPTKETNWYKEDWFGLKTLDEARKIHYVSVPGGHVEISWSNTIQYIIPYLYSRTVQQTGRYPFDPADANKIFWLQQ